MCWWRGADLRREVCVILSLIGCATAQHPVLAPEPGGYAGCKGCPQRSGFQVLRSPYRYLRSLFRVLSYLQLPLFCACLLWT